MSAWEKGDTMVQKVYFDHTISAKRGRPTNAEFIADLAERLRSGRVF